jgi:hypothetical protein
MPLLNPLLMEAKLIQVISTTTKHENKRFLSQLEGFSLHFSLGVEEWFWVEWVVRFSGFDCFLLLVVGGSGNELRSTLLTLILRSLKPNTQFACGFGCTLLNPLKSSSIIFLVKMVFSRRAVKEATSH